jgi:hypothetical protein
MKGTGAYQVNKRIKIVLGTLTVRLYPSAVKSIDYAPETICIQ